MRPSRPLRTAGGRPFPRTRLVLIERRVMREPVVLEFERDRHRASGFWRGGDFHRIGHTLGRRFEKGTAYMRVATDKGCFELQRVLEVNPWSWQARVRWELVAELTAIPVAPYAS